MNALEIWSRIDQIGIVVGLITAVPVFYSAWALWDDRKDNKRKLEAVRKKPGKKPTVLIIDVVKRDLQPIQAQVENWLLQQDDLKNIQPNSIYVAVFDGELGPDQVDGFIKTIRIEIGKLLATGTDKIHVFIRGPILIGTITGEILANTGAPVFLYHNTRNVSGYENWGQLHRT